jgi:hypothetical protein
MANIHPVEGCLVASSRLVHITACFLFAYITFLRRKRELVSMMHNNIVMLAVGWHAEVQASSGAARTRHVHVASFR